MGTLTRRAALGPPAPSSSTPAQPAPSPADEGSLLIVTLILTVVLASVVLAVTSYAAVGLRMSQVTDGRMGRLAAAEAGIWWGAEQLVSGEVACGELATEASDVDLQLNGERVSVACSDIGDDEYLLIGSLLMHGSATTVEATIQVPRHPGHLGTYRVLRFSVHG